MNEAEKEQQPPKKVLADVGSLKNFLHKFFDKVKSLKNLRVYHKAKNWSSAHKKTSIGLALICIIVLLIIGIKASGRDPQTVVGGTSSSSVQSSVGVNRRFEVPIKTKEGSETGEKLIITITNIDKTDNILIQNKPAKTKEGKTFLVINMEIQNDTKKQLKVKPVDMVRLVGEDMRNYAPDVHNNEVNVEAVSLRKTRVGYVVNKGQTKFKLLIGEVRGSQETIEIEL